MAHFAIIENGIVVEVITVGNDKLLVNGEETEQAGIDFLKSLPGFERKQFVQTSYNSSFRGVYAGIGYTYDEAKDIFINPNPPITYTPEP